MNEMGRNNIAMKTKSWYQEKDNFKQLFKEIYWPFTKFKEAQ
jgi:hypothetical protein